MGKVILYRPVNSSEYKVLEYDDDAEAERHFNKINKGFNSRLQQGTRVALDIDGDIVTEAPVMFDTHKVDFDDDPAAEAPEAVALEAADQSHFSAGTAAVVPEDAEVQDGHDEEADAANDTQESGSQPFIGHQS